MHVPELFFFLFSDRSHTRPVNSKWRPMKTLTWRSFSVSWWDRKFTDREAAEPVATWTHLLQVQRCGQCPPPPRPPCWSITSLHWMVKTREVYLLLLRQMFINKNTKSSSSSSRRNRTLCENHLPTGLTVSTESWMFLRKESTFKPEDHFPQATGTRCHSRREDQVLQGDEPRTHGRPGLQGPVPR